MYGGRGERGKEGTSGGPDEIVFKWSGARNDDRCDDDDDDGGGDPVESLTLLYGDHWALLLLRSRTDRRRRR